MMENQKFKYKFEVFDHTDNKNRTLSSVTDLGEPETKRSINIRINNRVTSHEITVLERTVLS